MSLSSAAITSLVERVANRLLRLQHSSPLRVHSPFSNEVVTAVSDAVFVETQTLQRHPSVASGDGKQLERYPSDGQQLQLYYPNAVNSDGQQLERYPSFSSIDDSQQWSFHFDAFTAKSCVQRNRHDFKRFVDSGWGMLR